MREVDANWKQYADVKMAYVTDADYARLKAEVERLTKAGDTLVAAYCMGDNNKERWAEYPVVREWLAAKGELP